MQYEVKICEVGPQLLAAARGHGNAQNYVDHLFALLKEVWTFLRANPQVKHEGLNVFLYHDENDKDLDQGKTRLARTDRAALIRLVLRTHHHCVSNIVGDYRRASLRRLLPIIS